MTFRPVSALREFLRHEAASGVLLMAVAVAALIVANSPLAPGYFHLLHLQLGFLPALEWINDGLMTLFFLMVGLEIKREMIEGQLSTWPRRALPGIAAVGGMAVPAGIYLLVQQGNPATLHGWAVPAATDIAFALGVITLLSSRVPVSLRIFLAAVAIIDDLGAVVIIALFYASDLHWWALAGVGGMSLVLLTLNRFKSDRIGFYLAAGALMWWFMLQSGVHATLAGVILALFIPMGKADGGPLHRLEHELAPWVSFVIVPLFGFANAGVSLAGVEMSSLFSSIPLGVALGLFLGKQIGVFGALFLTIKLGLAELPVAASWRQLYGTAVLCGIGFTMSLFIGLLAFEANGQRDLVKIGVLAGSVVSAITGAAILSRAARPTQS